MNAPRFLDDTLRSPQTLVAASTAHREWNGGVRQGAYGWSNAAGRFAASDSRMQSNVDGGAASQGGGTSPYQQSEKRISLRFADEHLEEAYLVFQAGELISQISLSIIGCVALLFQGLLAPNPWLLVRSLYLLVAGGCCACAILCALARFLVRHVGGVVGEANVFLELAQLRRHTGGRRGGGGRTTIKAEQVTILVAKIVEWLITGLLFFNSVYMAALTLGRAPCWNQPSLLERQRLCYNVYMFESASILVLCTVMVMLPIHVEYFSAACVSMLIAFVAANLLGPSEIFVVRRFYSSLVVVFCQLVVCVVWTYLRELESRHTFLTRLQHEAITAQMRVTRRLAGEAAQLKVPERIVESLSQRGKYEVFGRGIVLTLSAGNVSRWSMGRGPCDVVHALTRLSDAYHAAIEPLLRDPTLHVLRVISFGETSVFVIFPETSTTTHDLCEVRRSEGSPLVGGEGDDKDVVAMQAAARRVWAFATHAVLKGEEVCRVLGADVLGRPILVPWTQRNTRREGCGGGEKQQEVLLTPIVAAAVGAVSLKFIPALGGVVCVGQPIDECTSHINTFRRVHQQLPKIIATTTFATAMNLRDLQLPSHVIQQHEAAYESSHLSTGRGVGSGPSTSVDSTTSFPTTSSAPLLNNGSSFGSSPQSSPRRRQDPASADDVVKPFVEVASSYGQIYFTDTDEEVSFLTRMRTVFDLRQVNVNACSMLAMSAAMIVICVIQGVTQWAVRSPLPYCIGALLSGGLLLFCCHWSVVSRRCSVLEGCYWLFMMCCMASSVMADQYSSIFGGSLLPWVSISLMITLQRPLWYGPIAMWLVEAIPLLFGALLCLLPVRHIVSSAVVTYLLFYGVFAVATFVIRRQWDHAARAHYQAGRNLQRGRDILEFESKRLLEVLSVMMPKGAAAKVVERNRLRYGHRRLQKVTFGEMAFSTAMVDQGFGLIQFDRKGSGMTPQEVPRWITDVQGTMSSLFSLPHASVAVHSDGDVFFVTMDDSQHHTLPMGVGCATVVRALLRCRSMLLPTMRARAYLGACPMMGGLVGRRSATFEWYAPEVEAALQLIQMGAERTPLEWGMMVCSTRFLYHLRQSLASASDATFVAGSQWSEAVRWRVQGIGTLDVALLKEM